MLRNDPVELRSALDDEMPNLNRSRGGKSAVRSLVMRIAALAARLLPQPVKRALYRLGPVTDAIRRGLNRYAPTGMTPVKVAGGLARDARLVLDLRSEKDLWLGTYEPELQAAIRHLSRRGMVAYDVGANIGYVTILLARAGGPGSKVFAFEPLPENLARLRAHLSMNGLEERVSVVPAAVGDRAGTARFLVHASGGMGKLEGSEGRQARYEEAIEVETLTLDDFVMRGGNPMPFMIKIDVEGGEAKVIRGMQRLLEGTRPLILIEIHGPRAGRAVWDALSVADYRMHPMAHPGGTIDGPESLGWKAYVIGQPAEWRDDERP